jgi:hypothetical protein
MSALSILAKMIYRVLIPTRGNRWGEGTQIEPAAVDRACGGTWEGNETHLAVSPYVYHAYAEGNPNAFLDSLKTLGGHFHTHKSASGREEL